MLQWLKCLFMFGALIIQIAGGESLAVIMLLWLALMFDAYDDLLNKYFK